MDAVVVQVFAVALAVLVPVDDAHIAVVAGCGTHHRVVVLLLVRIGHTDRHEIHRLAARKVDQLLDHLFVADDAVRSEPVNDDAAAVPGSGRLLEHADGLSHLTVRLAIDVSVRERRLDRILRAGGDGIADHHDVGVAASCIGVIVVFRSIQVVGHLLRNGRDRWRRRLCAVSVPLGAVVIRLIRRGIVARRAVVRGLFDALRLGQG